MTCGKSYYFFNEHSSNDQANSIADYLPDDETFVAKNIKDTNTRKMIEVFGYQLKYFEDLENVFTNEMSPSCADQLMPQWESMLSIPDHCFRVEDKTIEERQRNALVKLSKMNAQTTEDFIKIAEEYDMEVTIQSGIDYSRETGYVFPLGDYEARFTIVVSFISDDIEKFPYTFPLTFGNEIMGILECIFKKVRPANCNVLFVIVEPKALITETYVMLTGDSTESSFSASIPIDNTGAYYDYQSSSISGFSIENIDTDVQLNQAEDTLYSNMLTDVCTATVLTISYTTLNQAEETLYSNMLTGVCTATIT